MEIIQSVMYMVAVWFGMWMERFLLKKQGKTYEKVKEENLELKDMLYSIEENRNYYKMLSDNYYDLNTRLKRLNYILEEEVKILKTQPEATTQHINPADQEIIEAVKYAMKMSHPDNNGNAKDFMKFRKLYKEIIERKGN